MAEKQYKLAKPAEEIDKILKTALTYGTNQTLTDAEKELVLQKLGFDASNFKIKILGYFNTLENLEAAITKPSPGDSYGVGTAYPYDIYVWNAISNRWLNNGPLEGAPGKDGIDAEVTPESITEALGYTPGMVNPNLLDNWYFGNPVNQRGQASYSGEKYSIDRWKLRGANTQISLSSDGINFGKGTTTGYALLCEYIDNFREGAEMTLSVLVDGTLATTHIPSGWVYNSSSEIILGKTNHSSSGGAPLNINLYTQPGSKLELRFYFAAATENAQSQTTITAAKLELGSVQTLAHQDADGNWVLNEIPNYAEQLARCQRFYVRYVLPSTIPIATGFGFSTNQLRVFISTPVPLRANASLTYSLLSASPSISAVSNGQFITFTTKISSMVVMPPGNAISYHSFGEVIQIITTENLFTTNEIYALSGVGLAIELSADL